MKFSGEKEVTINFIREKEVMVKLSICFSGFSTGVHHNIKKARELVNARTCQEIIVFPNINYAEI